MSGELKDNTEVKDTFDNPAEAGSDDNTYMGELQMGAGGLVPS